MTSPVVRFALLLLLGGLGGCRTTSSEEQAEKREAAESMRNQVTKIPVGTIHLVDPDGAFVLIRSSRFTDVDLDSELLVMDQGGTEIAKLRMSPARKGSFLTADILYGAPQRGNHVLMIHRPRTEIPTTGTTPSDEIQVLE